MPLRHILSVPGEGQPYLVGSCDSKDVSRALKLKQEAVKGFIEPCLYAMAVADQSALSDGRMKIISELLKAKSTQVYVNEEGSMTESPNAALILSDLGFHPFGNVCLDFCDKLLTKLGFSLKAFEKGG